MEKGTNSNIRYVLNYIGKDKLTEIDSYINKILQEESREFKSKEELEEYFKNFIDDFYSKTSDEERSKLLSYTGLDSRKVNQILRGYWDYEKNGALTPEIKEYANNLAKDLRRVLLKAPILPSNIVTYRGVGIPAFYSYNITNISDLEYLKGEFIYEDGFTSTSLLKDSSFYSKQPEWGDNCNIEIECLIPGYSEDGVALLDSNTSYSPNQFEFLINNSSLFKVLDVEIDSINNKAKIKMILIPQKLWNPLDYEMERSSIRLS